MKKIGKRKTALFVWMISLCSLSMAGEKTETMSVNQALSQLPAKVGKTITVKGTCSHVCSSSGKKIFLRTENGNKTLRFNAGKDIDKFSKDAVGKTVTITGVVKENRIYMADLDKLEAKALEAEKKEKKAEHCTADAKANGENIKDSPVRRLQAQKARLAKQIADGEKEYLVNYNINDCNIYSF